MTTNPYKSPESGRAKPPSTNIGLRRAVAIFVIVIAGPFAAMIAFISTCTACIAVPSSGALTAVLSLVLPSLAAGMAYSLAFYFTLPKRRIVATKRANTDENPSPSSASDDPTSTSPQPMYRTAVMLIVPFVIVFWTCIGIVCIPDLILTSTWRVQLGSDTIAIALLSIAATGLLGFIICVAVTLLLRRWNEKV